VKHTTGVKIKTNKKVVVPDICKIPYIPIKGVDQMVLPIREWLIPSGGLSKKIKLAKFPAFQRTHSGKLYTCTLKGEYGVCNRSNVLMREWIISYCTGRVVIDSTMCVFENEHDHLMALVSGMFRDAG
jgi:hypothetical protein